MKETEWYLASNSRVKQSLAEEMGGRVVRDESLLEKIQRAEDDFYEKLVDGLGLPDGLIVPYFIPYGEGRAALPVVVAKVKAEAVKQFMRENPSRIDAKTIVVNDSLWAVSNERGALSVAINKTDPERNSGDVERLSSFFVSVSGKDLYSVGCNSIIETVDGYSSIRIDALRVGIVRQMDQSESQQILSRNLKESGAFDLRFVLDGGLIESDGQLNSRPYEELHRRAHSLHTLDL